jgi:hypothetical protein
VAAAKKANLPATRQAARVTLTFDPHRRVHELIVRTAALAGSRTVTVTIDTTYRHFGHVAAVRKPG